MFLNFASVIAALGGNEAVFRIANETRPPGDYVFETILPERNVWSYHAESANMTIRPTMAGLVGMDSPYPPGGYIEASVFLEQTAKLALEVMLHERTMRQIQQMMMVLMSQQQPTNEAATNSVLNFLQKLVVQPLQDVAEWLRGQALSTGAINWTFNRKDLVISYGIPAANILAQAAGANAWDQASSLFWSNVTSLRRQLKANVRAYFAHPDTVDKIRYNPANNAVVTAGGDGSGPITFRKIIPATGDFTRDANDTVTIYAYGLEGEIINPANPASTIVIPFCPRNKLIAVANNTRPGFVVGEGSTPSPNAELELGYTHIGPTVEGDGRPGRWAKLYTPEARPWELHGMGAENLLPVIESPDKIAIASTA
jgi:hypothetical protein